ncbi:hypothetical protein K1719_023718 [Acacia pycnantha]|nr:hypothetical protein K1719_023718 [Acacia pycnantha]
MAAEAPLKNHKPHGRGSQPRCKNQGGKLKILFIPKFELDSSNSELDHSLDELSICEDFDVEQESELKNELEILYSPWTPFSASLPHYSLIFSSPGDDDL